MLKTRVIPCLLLRNGGLVKTVKFRSPHYVGDPVNVVRIFNEKEVDELVFLDILATPEGREPQFKLLAEIADECFMPFAYGGGIRRVDQIQQLFALGAEKVALNSIVAERPELVSEAAEQFGSQSIIASVDVRRTLVSGDRVFTHGGRRSTGIDPVTYAQRAERLGAGEILLTAMDRDGTFRGYDLDLIRRVAEAVSIPVIACGGAGRVEDFGHAVKDAGASAVAAGSMVVYQGPNRAVLTNFPSRAELRRVLEE